MTIFMYFLYVGVDCTYIDVNTLAQGIKYFWPHKFGFKPLLWLEATLTIRPPRHPLYVCMYVCMCVCVYECMYMCVYVYALKRS